MKNVPISHCILKKKIPCGLLLPYWKCSCNRTQLIFIICCVHQGELGIPGQRGSHGIPGDIGPEGPPGRRGRKGDHGESGAVGHKGMRVSTAPLSLDILIKLLLILKFPLS